MHTRDPAQDGIHRSSRRRSGCATIVRTSARNSDPRMSDMARMPPSTITAAARPSITRMPRGRAAEPPPPVIDTSYSALEVAGAAHRGDPEVASAHPLWVTLRPAAPPYCADTSSGAMRRTADDAQLDQRPAHPGGGGPDHCEHRDLRDRSRRASREPQAIDRNGLADPGARGPVLRLHRLPVVRQHVGRAQAPGPAGAGERRDDRPDGARRPDRRRPARPPHARGPRRRPAQPQPRRCCR